MRVQFSLALLLVLAHTAAGQVGPRPSRAEVAPEMRALHIMIGEWEVVERLDMAGGAEGRGRMKGRLGPGGYSVITDYTTTSGPMTGFRMHEILTWEPEDQTYRIIYVDEFTPGASVASGVREGDDIIFDRRHTRGGKVVISCSVISNLSSDRFVMSSFVATDGEPFRRTLTLTFTRRP